MKNLEIRHNWSLGEVKSLFDLPFIELLYYALAIRQKYFSANEMQISSLLSIKTGACPEDCAYCAQSAHHNGKIQSHRLLSLEEVISSAKKVKENGGTRFCMAASGRSPLENDFDQVLEMIKEVKKVGLESCVSLGLLTKAQTKSLKAAGLDYYNHNLDSSKEYYEKIISTRSYADRINTLKKLCDVGIKICCGGIIGMGEKLEDRIGLLLQLANFPKHPHSVPINYFMPMPGTPLVDVESIDPFDFVRVIAAARILMPRSFIRLAAGREKMSEELQALCFCAGANSIFCGNKLLTAKNPTVAKDNDLLARLGITNNLNSL